VCVFLAEDKHISVTLKHWLGPLALCARELTVEDYSI